MSAFIKCRTWLIGFVTVLLLFTTGTSVSHAQENQAALIKQISLKELLATVNNSSFQIKGDALDSRLVTHYFLTASYSNHLWMSDTGYSRDPQGYPLIKILDDPYFFTRSQDDINAAYPWLADFIYQPDGAPRFMGLNKWTEPVRISTRMPNDLKDVGKGWHNKEVDANSLFKVPYDNDFDENVENILQKEIEALSPELEKLIGLPVDFIPQAQETSEKYGKIRIVYTSRFMPSNLYKLEENPIIGVGYSGQPDFIENVEIYFQGAVKFTPESRAQVSGYFLPDKNNNIKFSICYIWQHHTPDMIRALVRECVLRSLGIPDFVTEPDTNYSRKTYKKVEDSVFSPWNDAPDQVSRRRIYEDREEFKKNSVLRVPVNELRSLATKNQSQLPLKYEARLSDFDRIMLRLLYDPALKPGMDYWNARNAVKELLNNSIKKGDSNE